MAILALAVVWLALAVGARPARADNVPTITIADVTQREGNAGTTPFVFTIALTQPSPVPVTVRAATYDGGAVAGIDYVANQAIVNFAPGQTSQSFTVQVNGDLRAQGNRAFSVFLDGETAAIVATRRATGTIVDDDLMPYVTVEPTTVTEGTATVNAVFPVRLSSASSQTVRVGYYTSDNSAHAGIDYQAANGTVTFAPGQTTASITVAVLVGVPDPGPSSSFYVHLRDQVNANITSSYQNAVGTINDHDSPPQVRINDVTVKEGNSGTTNANFTVSLSGPSTVGVTVDYATSDGTATVANHDYVPTSGTLSFAAGQTTKTVAVPVVGNLIHEDPSQQFALNLGGVTNATLTPYDSTGIGVILDDDAPVTAVPPGLSVDDVTVIQGGLGTTSHAQLTVSLSAASTAAVTASYITANGSAVAGTDYVGASGTVTFNAGETTKKVDLSVTGSWLQHPDRWFFVDLSNPSGATIIDGEGSVTIVDPYVDPTVAATIPVVKKGTTGTVNAVFHVNLSGPSQNTVTLNYVTSDWQATQPVDYLSAAGTLTFTPGQTTQAVSVVVNGDTIQEGDEQFVLSLSNATNASISQPQSTAVIVDENVDPTLSVGDTAVIEGTGTNTKTTFPVTLSGPSANVVTVTYRTNNWSATAPADYTTEAGTLTFNPGDTSKTVDVPIVGDSLQSNDKIFTLDVANPVNVSVIRSQGIARIINDDVNPWMSVRDASVVKPASGTASMVFQVDLTSASLNTVTVHYATADYSATQPGDYTATSGTLTFTPGLTSLPVPVPVVGNTLPVGDRRFVLNLSNATNATIETNSAFGVIVDPNLTPQLSVGGTAVLEGNSGTTHSAVFPVTLSSPSPNPVTVHYNTSDNSAIQTRDYVAQANTLTFAPGVTQKTVSVPVVGNTTVEPDKSFALNLSNATNAAIQTSSAFAVIINDDPSPPPSDSYVSVGDSAVAEGNSGTTNATFVVTLSPASPSPVTLKYATSIPWWMVNQVVPETGTLQFNPGETSKTVTVPVVGDTVVQGDRQFSLALSNLSGATFLRQNGVGAILDDDHTPYASIGDTAVTAGASGSATAAFAVRLTAPSPQPVSVDWSTSDGTARAPGDYLDNSGTLVIPANQTSAVISVAVPADPAWESPEYFTVRLSNVVGVNTLRWTGIAEIRGDIVSTVTGTVLDGTARPLAGVRVTRLGNALPAATSITDGSGAFSVANLPDGVYTLVPSAAGTTFVPAMLQVTVAGHNATVAFTAVSGTFISGRVTDAAGQPLAGVTVVRTGNSQPIISVQTNASGYYGMSSNPAGTYTVIPSLTGRSFSPVSRSVTVASTGVGSVNFQAS